MKNKRMSTNKVLQAYIIGVALGDGNLSNPNGRAVRLRVTCDSKYPKLAHHIKICLQRLLPDNTVSYVQRKQRYFDISCYSNHWETLLGWRVGQGSKIYQSVSVPSWIKKNHKLTQHCLRGLLQTDGSFYIDRGYPMINFTNAGKQLATDVRNMMRLLGFSPNAQELHTMRGTSKYTIRISKNTRRFVRCIGYWKS